MNWQTTVNTLVRPVNSRPTTMRKLYCLWWHERGILKVSTMLRKFLKHDLLFIQNNAAGMLSLQSFQHSYSLLWSPAGKVLIIGGSIANFTNVAATFKVKLLLERLHNVNFRTLALFKDLYCDCTHATTKTCIFTKACLECFRSFSPLSWPVLGPQGIVRAIKDYQTPLKEHEVTIFVRRGGPNYQEGLRVMGEVGECCVPSVIYMWIFVLMH